MTQSDAVLFFAIMSEVAEAKATPFPPTLIPQYLDHVAHVPFLRLLEALYTCLAIHNTTPTPRQLLDAAVLFHTEDTHHDKNH